MAEVLEGRAIMVGPPSHGVRSGQKLIDAMSRVLFACPDQAVPTDATASRPYPKASARPTAGVPAPIGNPWITAHRP